MEYNMKRMMGKMSKEMDLSHEGMMSKKKAKKILHDKTVRGKPLTEKQRKYFGARASGSKMKK